MKPEKPISSQGGMSLTNQDGVLKVPKNNNETNLHRDAATQIIRSQIDGLFELNNTNQLELSNPYQRTHTDQPDIKVDDWTKYHTAWQNYYQKYYEGYYKHSSSKTDPKNEGYKTFSADEAVFDMKQKIIGKVHNSATKIKKSRHFIPIISGIIVVLIFLLLQYNRFIISNVVAYVSPGNIDPQNIIIDPNADLAVGPDPKLIIPKINVDVPVIYDIGNDYESQMAAMSRGVAQFAIPGANSHPGQVGNTVIAGHSSNDLLDYGEYKFIFAQLDKLNVGDTIYANYQSKRYTYTVTKKETVKPSEVSKLVYQTTKPTLTLITCTPIGTAINRLLVTAEQISPDPNLSTPAPNIDESKTATIPGNSPTFLERIFGRN